MKKEIIREININSTTIDISDPCYDKDDKKYLKKKIIPGLYVCKAVVINNIITRGERVQSISIIRKDVSLKDIKRDNKIGIINVDSGLAGFFINKPDYKDDDWSNLCEWTWENEKEIIFLCSKDNPTNCIGCFVSSGYGDGRYSVYKYINNKDKTLAGYQIKFFN